MEPETPVKRKRGRPRKNPQSSIVLDAVDGVVIEQGTDLEAEKVPQPRQRKRRKLGDPGPPPNQDLHEALIMLFGPFNQMLDYAGGFDIEEKEFDLIFIPLERILSRRKALGIASKIGPSTLDLIYIITGVSTYGVRVAPQLKERLTTVKRTRGKPTVPGQGGSVQTNTFSPPRPVQFSQSRTAIDDYFEHVGSSNQEDITNHPLPNAVSG